MMSPVFLTLLVTYVSKIAAVLYLVGVCLVQILLVFHRHYHWNQRLRLLRLMND